MKIEIRDITSVDNGVIAHGVNCQGVMGSGLAKAIKAMYPIAFQSYKELCDGYRDKALLLGTGQIVNVTPVGQAKPIFVANCFTQVRYGRTGVWASPLSIELALGRVLPHARTLGIPFYMPPIGCGLGGLDWDEVEPVILKVEKQVGWPITLVDLDDRIINTTPQIIK